jgi:hypothetical protein
LTDPAEPTFAELLAGLEAPDVPPAVATIPSSKTVVCRAALESTAHLLTKVRMMWGTRDFKAFVDTLFVDARDGARKGLPVEVAAELLFLARIDKMRRALELVTKLNLSLKDACEQIERDDQGPLKVPHVLSSAAEAPTTQFMTGQKPAQAEDQSWRWKAAVLIIFAVAALAGGIFVGLQSAGFTF